MVLHVTHQWIEVQSYNFHYRTRHEQGNQLTGKFLFICLSSLQTKVKFIKKNQSHMIAST